MKISRLAAFGVIALAAVSCGKSARIHGTVAQAPDSEVIVKLLDVNAYKVLDTVKTDASGRFSYKVDVEAGQPEFVYVFYGQTKIASLLLEAGDNVTVSADTLGTYEVSGSEESVNLQQVERDYSAFQASMADVISEGAEGRLSEEEVNRQVSRQYVEYYRKAVAYVVSHQKSLTSVPVLFQNVSEGFPVFNRSTDAVQFRAVADSLKTVYPESKYVKAVEREAEKREQILNLQSRISSQETINFPEINLPDINGQKASLQAVDAKVIFLYFWTASDAAHKMFNVDSLLPLYKEYHDKGFEIYSVAVDTDKATWAASVRGQKLPWINVCDGRGADCPALPLYNVQAIPTGFLIKDGTLASERISGVEELGAYLRRTL